MKEQKIKKNVMQIQPQSVPRACSLNLHCQRNGHSKNRGNTNENGVTKSGGYFQVKYRGVGENNENSQHEGEKVPM